MPEEEGNNEQGGFMETLSDRLPIWHFDEDFLVFEDGSLGAGFCVSGADISNMGTFDLEGFNLGAKNMLLSIKEGYSLQIFHRLSADGRKIIKAHEDLMKNPIESAKMVKEHRINFLEKNAMVGNIFVPEIFIFVKSPPLLYKRQSLFGGMKFSRLSMEQYFIYKKNFSKEAIKIGNSLGIMGLQPQRVLKEDWFALLFSYFNLDRAEKTGIPLLRDGEGLFDDSLPDQIALSDLGIERDFLKIGRLFFKCVSLHTLPEGFTFDAMMEECLRLPFHFWISQKIHIPNQQTEITKLKTGRRLANSLVAGAEKISDLESESKLAQTEELLRELTEGGDKVVFSSFLVIVWGKSRDIADEKADRVLTSFKAMNQAEGIKEDYAGLEAFLGNFPGA